MNHTGWSTGFRVLSSDTSIDTDAGSSSRSGLTPGTSSSSIVDGVVDQYTEGSSGLESRTVEPDVELSSRSISSLGPWELSLGSSISTDLIFVMKEDPDVDVLVGSTLLHGIAIGSSSSTSGGSDGLGSNEGSVFTELGGLAGTINLGGVSQGSPFDSGSGIGGPSVNLQGAGQLSDSPLDGVGTDDINTDGLGLVVE